MTSILQTNPFLAVAFFVIVAVALFARFRRRQERSSRQTVGREGLCFRDTPRKHARGGRRTSLVTDAEWEAFRQIKAGITGQKGEVAVGRALALLGAPALHDVILVDSRGLTQIDHLVLGLDAIIVLETKTYSGFITGSVHSQEWTQHLADGATWTNFQNPFRQNHRHCVATSEIVGDLNVVVRGYVVSAGTARFSDAIAGDVLPIDNISEILIPNDGARADQNALQLAWERLVVAARANEARRAEHLEGVRAKRRLVA